MFERFTEKAIKVIMLAQEEARRLGHNFVGAEFIFLGLIGEASGVASQVLRQQGITLKNARIEVEKILGKGSGISPEMNPVDIPFTESAKLVLNSALSFADKLGSESIDTEHLLIGIFQQGESTAIILQNLQVNLKDLTVSLTQYFQQQPSNQLPQTVYVLLYNVGADDEGIHTISTGNKDTILIFETQEDAATFARRLGEQNFPVPSVEAIEYEDILGFCQQQGDDWEFVAQGTNRTPPSQNQTINQQNNFVDQSSQGLTLNTEIPNQQEYVRFLMETLRKISENPNPQVIYPFWAQNLDKLDDNLARILDSLARKTLTQAAQEQAYAFAVVVIGNFINLIRQFPLGDIAAHKEIAITGYEIALTIFTFEAFPQDWAMTQNNLANAYCDRIRGEKAENLERAIAAYQEALKVYTFDEFPQQWSDTQNNLAIAYRNRIRGDKAENLERSIAAYQESLKVRTFDAFPKAYLNLINQLLSCNDGDEPRIMQENQELLDEGLVQVMVAVAQQYGNAGRENEARWLIYIAQQLAEDLEIWSDETTEKVNTDQDYLTFFGEVLQLLTNDPDINIKIIYPFFEKNLDKLDENLIAVLDNFVRNILLPSADSETARTITASIVNFSRLIQEFPHGDISMNQEIAIAGNELVLTIDNDPIDRALTQNNLGIAYRNRIKGDKAENLEIAISLYNEALRIRTFDAFPQNWAATQNNLANVYRERIMGDKADNLDKAIATYTEVLKVYTFDAFPKQWAEIQNNLALAYSDRIRGEKAENLERAIATYKEVLKVYTFDSFPEKWAYIQNLLGATYIERIKGNKVENLEQAIAACNEALKVYTIETFPQDWAMTQNLLALAYSYRILGDKDDNIEKAINTYAVAEQVITFDTDSESWAIIQNNLGIAYYERIRGDKAENLEKALEVYESSLKIRTFEQFPEYWADTQHNLGNTYRQRIKGDKAENIEKSIEAYTNALKVRTFENSPLLWAETRNSLGNAYCQRKVGNKAENLKKAITLFTDALKIWTNENNLFSCLMVASNLANLYYNEEQWQPATEAYHIAIEAVENARLEALNPRSREQTLSHAIGVFHRIVQAYLNFNQPEKALEYIERSKGRNLVELITQKNLNPQGVSQEIIAQLNELKQRVFNEKIRLHHQSINQNLMRSDNLTPYVPDHSYLKEYQQDLDNFIAREIKDPLFSLTQKVEPIPFTEIQALTDAETCLLQWYITGEKILAFVVSAEGEVKVWQSSEDDVKQLFDTINNYLQLYYSKNGKQEWRNQLSNLLQTFAETLHINDIFALIPDTCQRLIIIPHVYLHILPIHAFPINKNQILQDKYDVQYAPSCQILQKISQTSHHSDFNKLFAIQNPTKDLSYTDLEVNILSTFFTEPQVIAQDNATKNAVLPHLKSSDNHCYHFSCHGSFNPANPLESALFLANKEPLTLGEIFELRLNKCRLVTLSACETGLIDLNSISDEYIGLPSGFLFAGSPSVVSSLWTVNDLSTSFLMIKLYEILFNENQQVSVPVALKMAQNWLKNLTSEQFILEADSMIDKLCHDKPRTAKSYKESARQLLVQNPEEYPLKNPFYWAAFIASGQ
ncbi:DUF3110 domain-containing protein [Microcystis viridis]|uniref:DUF3110 domain-containing protein n=1 Tax=Microcystis viridis FACHB-1342 TaxID=2692900 RepID=A0ABR8GD44_MICVR|nr:DUF3110 domain-containing protein [Microcystis viridis]MBD2601263.1 DUF3110 domain-containing protein [Microcystis viridis FACHB-1342]